MIKLKEFSSRRNFFPLNVAFDSAHKPLLDAYEEAAQNAARKARVAVRDGDDVAMREAQWWEAVTCTLELSLQSVVDGDPEGSISLPNPPEFKSKA